MLFEFRFYPTCLIYLLITRKMGKRTKNSMEKEEMIRDSFAFRFESIISRFLCIEKICFASIFSFCRFVAFRLPHKRDRY